MGTTAPAWQARDYQRHKFVEKMMDKINLDPASEDGLFTEDLLLALITRIAQHHHSTTAYYTRVQAVLRITITPLVDEIESETIKFSRAREEATHVLGLIAQKLFNSIQTQLYADINKKQMFEPERILGAKNAQDEVEIPDD